MSTNPGTDFSETLFGDEDADRIFGWDTGNSAWDFGSVEDGDILGVNEDADSLDGGSGKDQMFGDVTGGRDISVA